MKGYKPVYKEAPKPLVGFECISTRGADIRVETLEEDREIRMFIGNNSATWSKSDLNDFIDTLIEVKNNIK